MRINFRKWLIVRSRYEVAGLFLIVILAMLHGVLADNFAQSVDAMMATWHIPSHGLWPWDGLEVSPRRAIPMVLAGLAFAFVTLTLYRLRHRLLSTSGHVSQADSHHPHEVLIITLSPLSPTGDHFIKRFPGKEGEIRHATTARYRKYLLAEVEKAWNGVDTAEGVLAVLDRFTKNFSLDQNHPDCAAFCCNWQQPLRVIREELRREVNSKHKLERIIVLCTEAAHKDWEYWRQIIAPILSRGGDAMDMKAHIMSAKDGDFKDFYHEYVEVIEEMAQPIGREREICIDLTGGTKEQSIVGALVTLNRRMTFCYVSNIGKLYFYDLNFSTGESFSG